MKYTSRPKTTAGRIAWDMFTKAIGSPPVFMAYGHGIDYGWCWTAEDSERHIWVYTASWSHAINAHNVRRYSFAQ